MMIHDKSAIQDETEQKLDEADQAAAAGPSRYAETDVFARVNNYIEASKARCPLWATRH